MSNSVVQWQIIAKDPEAVTKFYGSLFGWSVSKDNALGYREIKTGNAQGIDGGVWPAPPEAPNFVQLFIEVDDADAMIRKATGLGARILVPKSALPDGDALAILQDPTGLSFGILQRQGV